MPQMDTLFFDEQILALAFTFIVLYGWFKSEMLTSLSTIMKGRNLYATNYVRAKEQLHTELLFVVPSYQQHIRKIN